MTKRFTFITLLLLFLVAACGKVADSYELESGATLEGNQHLVVVNATLEQNSLVEGDLNITAASDVVINSHIKGDLTVFASNLTLDSHSLIEGDLVYCLLKDGEFNQDEQAVIWGEIRNNCNEKHPLTSRHESRNKWWVLLGNVILSLVAGMFAALASIFFPKQLNRIALAAQERRWRSLGLGALTLVVAVGLSSLWGLSLKVIVPIILAPVIALVWLWLLFLMLLGALAIAQVFGAWFAGLLRRKALPPILTTMLGMMMITFFILSFQLLSPLGFLTPLTGLVWWTWALGAGLLTRAGTRPYKSV